MGPDGTQNKALSRYFINLVVFNAVLEERVEMVPTKELSLLPVSNTPPNPGRKGAPSTPNPKVGLFRDEPKLLEIGLYFENELKLKVMFEGKKHILTGVADYSLGLKQLGSRFGNLVLVEAKKRYCIGNAYGQLLAYMG